MRTAHLLLLAVLAAPDAVPALIARLRDPSPAVRAGAARGLEHVGSPGARPAEAALRNALEDKDAVVRVRAASALATLDVPLVEIKPVVGHALETGDGRTRVEAARVWLVMDGDRRDAVTALAEALHDADDAVRRDAIGILEEMQPLPAAAVAVVRAALKDKDARVRSSAAHALTRLDAKDKGGALDEWLTALRDPDSLVRERAIDGLTALGRTSPAVAPALVRSLKDPDPILRAAAADVVAELEAKSALPVLQELWRNEKDPRVRRAVGDALEALGETVTW